MGVIAKAVKETGNRKLGKNVAITMAAQGSCPTTCPMLNAGCYAQMGRHGLHTMHLNSDAKEMGATPLEIAIAESAALDTLNTTNALRVHTVGDCSTPETAQIVGGAITRFKNRGGGPAWGYTHASKDVPREAWGDDVSMLASCETKEEAKAAIERGYAPAMVVENHPEDGKAYYEDGLKMIPCVNQTHPGVTCSTCRLCWDDKKLLAQKAVITFEAHGSGRKRVLNMLHIKNGV